MGGGSLLSWCVRCLGVGAPGKIIPQHPLASAQTSIHRTVSRGQDSDESEGEEDDDKESFVHKCLPGPATPLLHPPPLPPTVPVRVQPRSIPLHRPVPHSPGQLPPGPCNEAHRDSLDSSPGPVSPPASPTTTTSRSNSPASSTCGSQLSLHSQHSRLSALLPDDNSGQSLAGDGTPKRQIRFMTPEEAARSPQDSPAPRVVEFPQSGKSGLARGGDMLRSLFGMEDPVSYAGQYALHGSSKPIKIRSYTTLHAISSYHGRAETSSTPSRYSFGKLELALRYRTSEHMLDVRVRQITQLPPGKKDLKLDLHVSVSPGKKEKWVKGVLAGPRQADDTQAHSGSIKLRKVSKRCLVVSAYQPGLHSHPYLALGHGIVANLGAQPLEEGWQPCTLQLRQGWQVQDHLGMALVALSCCERERGYLTFTVDVLQMKKMKVLRLGSKIASSFKTKLVVQVVAVVVTEGSRARKEELGGTTLEVPRDSSEKSWEGVFKNTCSHTFSVPKSKATASCAVLEMHGRARHGVTFSEALLGKVILGPEELFGGEDQGCPMLGAPQAAVTVPGDPMDARLTHWGLSIRRKARIEMWHRLQI